MENYKKNKNEFLVIPFLIVAALLITMHSSVINPMSGDNSNDSWVFRYMGMLIAKGGIPYRDAFDQKGPLLYFFEFLGYKLQREYGIWTIEVVSMTIFLIFLYRICRNYISIKVSLIVSLVSVGCLSLYFSGNMCEEFSLPFIAASLYIFVEYFIFERTSSIRIVLCGICCGCVLMLRPNMVALWVVMCMAVVIDSLFRTKAFPVKLSFLFILGVLMSVLPFIIWLFSNDALDDFVMQYLLHNAKYTSGPYSLKEHLKLIIVFANGSMLVIPIFLLVITAVRNKKLRFFNITYVTFILLNIFLCSISVRGFMHYAMPIAISHAYPLALFSKIMIDKFLESKKKLYNYIRYLIYAVYSFTLIIFVVNNVYSYIKTCISYKPSRYDVDVINEINELCDEEDRILVLGHGSRIYYEADRLCSAKYFIQEPIYYNNNTVLDDMKESLNSNLPVIVINYFTEEDGIYNTFFEHMDEYTLIDKNTKLYLKKT